MTRVPLIGIEPEAVDTSGSDLPPGTTAEKIAAGIEPTLADMKGRGWEAAFCSILPDESAEATVAAPLAEPWDCIVIGGGIRCPHAASTSSSASSTPSTAARRARRSPSTLRRRIPPMQQRGG